VPVTILDVCDLSVERSGKVVIRDVCLQVTEGDFVGIVGPNGSGKSTLLLAILGVLKPKSGTIQVYGKPPNSVITNKKNRMGISSSRKPTEECQDNSERIGKARNDKPGKHVRSTQ
jgi:ABC-type cobalamin/Fe3+-siderophores transport system ATPase subunit